MDEPRLLALTPSVIGVLVRRGADFAAAEDAVQEALVEAVRLWADEPPRDPKGWLVTVAWRKFLDAARADASRRRREELIEDEQAPVPGTSVDALRAARRDDHDVDARRDTTARLRTQRVDAQQHGMRESLLRPCSVNRASTGPSLPPGRRPWTW